MEIMHVISFCTYVENSGCYDGTRIRYRFRTVRGHFGPWGRCQNRAEIGHGKYNLGGFMAEKFDT
ncbi:hypothetical protein DPMN_006845 [Dreissena polymorpha]|uniref:Uncharacterized protein n=1 Tax=Dreissena polymorpha TaxID=45954 RepID=A0A9D4RVR5_DREPO|nr:hypothetical protein DPMN_006845 [Dreissena polymorpha]